GSWGRIVSDHKTDDKFINRLFVPRQRFGWQYVPPPGPEEAAHRLPEPIWHEPPMPDESGFTEGDRYWSGPAYASIAVAVIAMLVGVIAILRALWQVVTFSFAGVGGLLLVALVCGVVFLVAVTVCSGQRKRTAEFERDLAYREHLRRHAAWQREVAKWAADTNIWFPLGLHARAARVNVFGGSGDSWASLLMSTCTTLLSAGRRLTVVDFTEQAVGGGIASLAQHRGERAVDVDLPGDLDAYEPCSGLTPLEVGEVLAAAVSTMRPGAPDPVLQALDAELLTTVAERLNGAVTLPRLTTGLRVLRRVQDFGDTQPLSEQEYTRINECVDTVAAGERERQELQFLTNVLAVLTRTTATGPEMASRGGERISFFGTPPVSVTSVTTSDSDERRKDVTDRLVFQLLLHQLRTGRRGMEDMVLVVAGADYLGLNALETLSQQARRSGVQLMLLMERIGEDLASLLGATDSVTLLMRLGNPRDATLAAEFVGREHKFVFNQVTESVGRTFTEGTSTSESTAESVGGSRGTGSSSGIRSSWSRTSSRMSTWGRTQTHGTGTSSSVADSKTRGTTESRVYEFAVEPTVVQGLPTTAFFLVEADGRSGRRVVLGDCNPGIALLDKVAEEPLEID
ncbi:hypothetical protein ACFC1B_29915, partial [Streptomyces xiamenensis]|uniref:hypothetical protein n=1 Tax=Streptomyces xiamenensis TaxID=408015 RepID=UPI0035E02143